MADEAPEPCPPLGIPRQVRDLLACPRCRDALTDVVEGDAQGRLLCTRCHQSYPVHGGVPWLIPEHARDEGPR